MYIYVSRLAFLFFLIAEKRTATFESRISNEQVFCPLVAAIPTYVRTYVHRSEARKIACSYQMFRKFT